MTLNIQLLCSGRQFASSAAPTPKPTAMLTHDQRIAAFFAQTSQAAAAIQDAKQNAATMVNVDFLRSGSTFTTPTLTDDSAISTSTGFAKTRAQRLEEFYKATQQKAVIFPPRAAAVAEEGVPTMVNLQFLTSGKEFEALQVSPPPSSSFSGAKMSRNARLEAFYKATQANAIKTPRAAAVAQEGVPTMVNLQFLTSGKEFEALQVSSPPSSSFSGAKMSRNARLEAFYKATQANAVKTPRAVRRTTVVSPPPTMVNMQFLRSGKEFFSVARQDRSVEKAKVSAAKAQWKNPGPKTSRYARQLAFYKSTQAAAAPVMTKTTVVRTPLIHTPPISSLQETIVNLKFLRSGKEFASRGPSKQKAAFAARPSGFPDFGPKKSRNARLEEFYTRSAPAPAVNAVAAAAATKVIGTSG